MAIANGHRGRVEGRFRCALAGDHDHAAGCLQRLAEKGDRSFGDRGRVHSVLELDHHQPGQSESDEGLALASTAHGAEEVVGIEAGAGNGRIADASGQFAVDAAGGDRDRQPAVRIPRHRSHRVSPLEELLPLAIGDEDRRVAHLDPVLAREP